MASGRPQRRQLLMTAVAATWCVFFLTSGCTDIQYRSRSMERVSAGTGKNASITPGELRLKIHGLANRFAGRIEASADQIIAEADAPGIRREALLWKINAIPVFYNTIFQPDPFIAFVDTWALSAQMAQYFESGPGRESLGDRHTVALDASRQMVADVEAIAIAANPIGNIDGAREKIDNWVAAHPIDSSLFIRDSISQKMAGKIGGQSMGTLELVGELAVGFADLSAQMTAYANYLPKQARWQTELLLEDMAAADMADDALANFSRITEAVERMAVMLEQSGELIARERKALEALMKRERGAALSEIDRQRMATIDALRMERQAVMASVTAERLAISELVRTERAQTMVDLDHMRSISMELFEETSERLLQQTLERSREYIDHFFFRSAQLSAVILGVLLVAGYVLVILIRRKP